ncbi:Serine/Threonine-kinase [Hirschfeldia incana]|nr:Serine/Threonine-kinase [Hirschfeldia incana]
MEMIKPKVSDSKKIATKAEDEKKTKKDDVMTNNGQKFTFIKGHLKISEDLRQGKTKYDQSSKSPRSSSSSSYVMEIKMGNYKTSIQRSENTNRMETQHKGKKVMNLKQNTEESNVQKMKNKKVWDCESTLYDSFELNSFNRQLDNAISSSARSMSMPHLPPPPSEITPSSSTKKQPSNKITHSLKKFVKSIFRQKQSNTPFKACHGVDMDKYYVVFDNTGSLTTIPESRESLELGRSEINSLDRKTVSERFPPSRLAGIFSS